MAEIEAVMWKVSKESDTYVFQLTSGSQRLLKKAIKEVGGRESGNGYDALRNKKIVLLQRDFEDKESLKEFANGLSFNLSEISKTGKERIINAKRKKKN
tara:strand:+ start:7014 stop:7310 length:297 start_codon:yes stop_codon:yes gene_type:complete